jgi:hypothetical protein
MAFPTPEPGLVIAFSYLCSEEAEQGHAEGSKTRPCAIVVAQILEEGQAPRVVVAPITHSPPANPDRALELPAAIRRHLGLDEDGSWIILDDFNVFTWPGFDLRTDPKTGRCDYGFLPPLFFEQMRRKYLQLIATSAASVTARDEAAT